MFLENSDFHSTLVYALANDSKTSKELRDSIDSKFGVLRSQLVDETITHSETAFLQALTRRQEAQTGPFPLNAADGHPRVGMTNAMMSLHAISLTIE